MRRAFISALVLVTLIGGGIFIGDRQSVDAQSRGPQKRTEQVEFAPDTILVKPRRGVSVAALALEHAASKVKVDMTFPEIGNLQILKLPKGLSVADAVARYSRNPNVEYAEPDYIYHTTQQQVFPNDYSSALWALHNTGQNSGTPDADIDAPEAWALRTDASEIIVGVIDTGIDYNHPDLAGNMWVNTGEIPGNGIDDDGNGYIDDVYGINGINNSGNPWDDQYHGTHVAGTIGAVGNNGTGLSGVAWNVKLMALKFLSSSGSGSSSDAIKCIDYGVRMGAHVLNNSWGGGGYSQALYDAIMRARNAGVLFVAAAGNSNVNNDTANFYPASYQIDNVLAVASTDRNDIRSSFSNYGYQRVGIGAPGSNIYSTYPNNNYNTISGTSMASPHVAGAAALLMAHRPDLTTHQSVIQHLLMSTDPNNSLRDVTVSGGRLNLYKALSGDIRPIAHFRASAQSGGAGSTFTFTDSSIAQDVLSKTINFGDGSAAQPFNGTASKVYSSNGTYTVTVTVTTLDGKVGTRSMPITVQPNYEVVSDSFSWINTSGLNSVSLSDDSSTSLISLPFVFNLYGQNFNSISIGSNGLIVLGSTSGANAHSNTAIPNTAAPNAALYPYWDDLNPAAGGTIRHGSVTGGYLVSWEGVPIYGQNSTTMWFQALIGSDGTVKFQYGDIKQSSSMGGGRSATVGIENGTGTLARQYSFNGSPLLQNNSALLFRPDGGVQPPAAPSNLGASIASSTQINLTWNDNSSNESGFEIQRSSDGFNTASTVSVGANVRTYSDTGLTPGTSYSYRVRSFNDGGYSAFSNQVNATTPQPPNAPSGLSATAVSSSRIDLAWTDNSNDESGFRIERRTASGSYSQIAQVGSNTRTFSNTSLASGTQYFYRVVAYNSAGNSSYSNEADARTLDAPPVAPSNVKATANSSSQITLTWTQNGTYTHFIVERQDGRTWIVLNNNVTTTSFVNTGLRSRTKYTYRVRTANGSLLSPYSASVSATTLR
jgi:subtilisin family serine protease